jgi:phospholipase/lecithinase/hemolysin
MKTVFTVFLGLVVGFCMMTASATPAHFNKIVFFGDSLTDNGNLYQTDLGFLPKSPPYFKGRFTNGFTWAEQLATHFKHNGVTSENYAVGGETVVTHGISDKYLPYTLTQSLDRYYFSHIFQSKKNTLFIIWIGANDYLPGVEFDADLIQNVILTLQANMQSLIDHGAKNLIVLNLPEMSVTPRAMENHHGKLYQKITEAHNRKLAEMMSTFMTNHANINIELYDVHTEFSDIIVNIDKYNRVNHMHIHNTTDSCWPGGMMLQQLESALIAKKLSVDTALTTHLDKTHFGEYIAKNPDLTEAYTIQKRQEIGFQACPNPDDYVFWDGLHPTSVMHRLLAINIIPFIERYYP